jgi:UDP-2,3-diacylglucosamine pyrophosphatase LpxH
MHDRLLEALLKIADVRVVAALRDPGLAFPSTKDLRVFIPDMHLSSAATRARYHYGFNGEPLLIAVLGALERLKTGREAGETVEVYHIGDYLDLWRESLKPPVDESVAADIKADHADLAEAMESEALDVHFLLGNHDFDLWQWHDYSLWDRRYYLPAGNDPGLLVMHGDYFDWVELVPEFAKEMAVHLFARGLKPTPIVLGKMLHQTQGLLKAKGAMSDHLQLASPAETGTMLDAEGTIPARHNVQESGVFLDAAAAECAKANRDFELNMKAVIIGHTHQARIAVTRAADGGLFTLIDTGAWIEQCCEVAGGPAEDNAQITAVSGNEVRIYQLAER